ncbi:MAG: hypothetical protein HY692_00560 [Cyanobacteria bacterium NC_groundwater_1444_Ag_S-0.65um_54_12]|nr:hypothetical protein [Cyanobacteria bacterium NC_groundwater_1444_Ag_S-0.65um_54_12]
MAIPGSLYGMPVPPASKSFSALANDANIAGMRIAVPVIQSVRSIQGASEAMELLQQANNSFRLMTNGAKGGIGGVRNVIGSGLRELPNLFGANFAIAGLMSIFTNTIDWVRGKATGTQFFAGTVADTLAYTGIGAGATMLGGMLGSIIPGIGTIVGMGVGAIAGFLGGKLYEDNVRPSFVGLLEGKFATPPAAAPASSPLPEDAFNFLS